MEGETVDLLVLWAPLQARSLQLLERLVSGLSRLQGLEADEKLRRFLALRERAVRVEGFRRSTRPGQRPQANGAT